MGSQKNLSHSSLIDSAAPPRRPRRRPGISRFFLGRRASSLDEVSAARGGLVGGEGSPEEGTSGIPLGPCNPRRAVVEALEVGSRVDDVARGKDINPLGSVLAVITT
jgi:hypothetical protein